MKKVLMLLVLAFGFCAYADEVKISLVDASGKIAAIIEKPSMMTDIVSKMAPADQVAFLKKVNESLAGLPGSTEENIAKFALVNSAALKGATKSNVPAMLAEVYATVPPAALTVINERFASALFNRAGDPAATYTDEQYTKIAKDTIAKIIERCEQTDDSAVRETFAILQLLRGSNGTPADLADQLVALLPSSEAKGMAKDGWINPAMGIGQEKTYGPLLSACGQVSVPNLNAVFTILPIETLTMMLADIDTGNIGTTPFSGNSPEFVSVAVPRFAEDIGLERIPRSLEVNAPFNPIYNRDEPCPYRWQSIQ